MCSKRAPTLLRPVKVLRNSSQRSSSACSRTNEILPGSTYFTQFEAYITLFRPEVQTELSFSVVRRNSQCDSALDLRFLELRCMEHGQ